YDNSTLRLYINGVEVGSFKVEGTLAPAAGPFLMGNDGSKRVFSGRIDNAFLDARALSSDEVLKLTCLHNAPTVTATPAISMPTPAGDTASFDIAISNNDSPICGASDFTLFVNFFQGGFTVQTHFQ